MNKAATSAIWARFSDRLRRFIAGRVRRENDVQDVLQDVFARIHSGLGGVKDTQKLEAWLFQVARRSIANHFRIRRSSPLPEEIAGEEPNGGVSAEVASWLEPMMSLISQEDREALRLADLEGLAQKDFAKRLGLSLTGAKSRIQRARKRLKAALLDCCHIEVDRRGNAIDYIRKGECRACSCS